MDLDRERLERCLTQVGAYRASGKKAKAWAQANGVELNELQSWCAHAGRWRSRLDGVTQARPAAQPGGFVAVRVPVAPVALAPSIRVELGSDAGRVDVHWPLSHARELASWLREFSR